MDFSSGLSAVMEDAVEKANDVNSQMDSLSKNGDLSDPRNMLKMQEMVNLFSNMLGLASSVQKAKNTVTENILRNI